MARFSSNLRGVFGAGASVVAAFKGPGVPCVLLRPLRGTRSLKVGISGAEKFEVLSTVFPYRGVP